MKVSCHFTLSKSTSAVASRRSKFSNPRKNQLSWATFRVFCDVFSPSVRLCRCFNLRSVDCFKPIRSPRRRERFEFAFAATDSIATPSLRPTLSSRSAATLLHEVASSPKMSGRIGGGRERPRRLEDRNSSAQGSAPPSRHLWVGNLSHSISEDDLLRPFLRFGELESVAFQPGRSYAFINFKIDEGAIAALKALQGFPLAGSPLRIEFAKVVSPAPNLCHSLNFKHLVVWSYF
ncbi:RRM domain-containing protein [Psidium guajava]|nr:RRM domain-containing protein [Psidium guajava]